MESRRKTDGQFELPREHKRNQREDTYWGQKGKIPSGDLSGWALVSREKRADKDKRLNPTTAPLLDCDAPRWVSELMASRALILTTTSPRLRTELGGAKRGKSQAFTIDSTYNLTKRKRQ